MLRYGSKKDIEAFVDAIRGKLFSMATHQIASVGYRIDRYYVACDWVCIWRDSHSTSEFPPVWSNDPLQFWFIGIISSSVYQCERYRSGINSWYSKEGSISQESNHWKPLKCDNKVGWFIQILFIIQINKGLLDHSYAHKLIYEFIQIADPKVILFLLAHC